jgi:hypothetical protein
VTFRVVQKQIIADCLNLIGILKACLESPAYSAADKIEFAELVETFMSAAGEWYDGSWPNAITPAELRSLRPVLAELARRPVAPHMLAALAGAPGCGSTH